MSKVTVTTKREFDVPDSDIVVLLEMAGYGIAYWASSMSVRDRKVTILEQEGHSSDGPEEHVRTFEQLAEVLVKIGVGDEKYGSAYNDYAKAYLRDLDDPTEAEWAAGNIDSDLADHVIQYAVFGELIYG